MVCNFVKLCIITKLKQSHNFPFLRYLCTAVLGVDCSSVCSTNTVPCVKNVRANSSFKSLKLEWDPVIFPNVKIIVKIAKKGTNIWYHFQLNQETTTLFVPDLEPGMKYKYKICVMIGPFSMECGEGCISTCK